MKTAQDLLSSLGNRSKGLAIDLTDWYRANQKDWPWRKKFRESGSPYPVWISEIMLQQTTIQAVLPAYYRFLERFPTLGQLALGTEDEVREACRGLGYYRRFRLMHEAAKGLYVRGDDWPRDFAGWKELPGVGDYTAAAISSIAFAYPKAVVDGNVERVMARLFNLAVEISPAWKKVFQAVLDKVIIGVDPSEFNQGMMELGQTVCVKGAPRCPLCPVASYCAAFNAGTESLVPLAKPKVEMEQVRLALYIQEKRGRVGLLKRNEKAKFLRGTDSFPSAVVLDDGLVWETPRLGISDAVEIGRIKHSITKNRIEVVVFTLPKVTDVPEMKWVLIEEVEAKLVSNMDRKAFHLWQKLRKRLRPSDSGLESFG